jgi:hypothetical protein
MIYFIQAGPGGPIKIGYAIDVQVRVKQLQTGSHEELVTLKSIPGDKKREMAIHKALSVYRKQGEWFHPTGEVLSFIEQLDGAEYEMDGLHAYAVLRRDSERGETDPCPFCGRRHTHGDGDGHRVAHCSSAETRREIQVEGVTLRKSDGYIIRTRWRERL